MTFINYYKVSEDENGQLELKHVELAGIAQEGIVLDAGKLNNELSDAVQYFYNMGWHSKYDKLVKAYNICTGAQTVDRNKEADLLEQMNEIESIIEMLEESTTPAASDYTFINRIALSILNTKNYRITGEVALYNALKTTIVNESAQLNDLSDTRNKIIPILAEMLAVKECPYLKPVNIKLNLKEVSQLIAIANSTRTRWTNKGIKTKYSKTIETDVAIQCILFVCRNAFNMVIPVKAGKDERKTV